MQPNYRIYATLLDSYFNYLNSDVIYERYYGWSENPPCTEEEFRQKQFQELIDRINRKPFDSEAADKEQPLMRLLTVWLKIGNPKLCRLKRYIR